MFNNFISDRKFSLGDSILNQPKQTNNVLETNSVSIMDTNPTMPDAGIDDSHALFNATGTFFELLQMVSTINFQSIEADMQYKLKSAKSVGEFCKLKNDLTIKFANAIKEIVNAKIKEVADKIDGSSWLTGLFSFAKVIAGAVLIVASLGTGPLGGVVGTAAGVMLIQEGYVGLYEAAEMQELAQEIATNIANGTVVDMGEVSKRLEGIMTMIQYGLLGLAGEDAAKWASLGTNLVLGVLTLGATVAEIVALRATMTAVGSQIGKIIALVIKVADLLTQLSSIVLQALNTAGVFNDKQNSDTHNGHDSDSKYNYGQKITQATQMGFLAGAVFMALDGILHATDFDKDNPIATAALEGGFSLLVTVGSMYYTRKTTTDFSNLQDLEKQMENSGLFNKLLFNVAKMCQSDKFKLSQAIIEIAMATQGVSQGATSTNMGYLNASVQATTAESANDSKRMEEILAMAIQSIESITQRNDDLSKQVDNHLTTVMNENQQFIYNHFSGQIFGG